MYVISYDIPDDRQRRKIAKCLENYGKRIQYSVFECHISEASFQKLYEKLAKLTMDLQDGSIYVFRLCKNCETKTIILGQERESVFVQEDDIYII